MSRDVPIVCRKCGAHSPPIRKNTGPATVLLLLGLFILGLLLAQSRAEDSPEMSPLVLAMGCLPLLFGARLIGPQVRARRCRSCNSRDVVEQDSKAAQLLRPEFKNSKTPGMHE